MVPIETFPNSEIESKLLDSLGRLDRQSGALSDGSISRVTLPPRQLISDVAIDGEFRLLLLRHGWAMRFLLLPDGRRQILKFLIPGDFVNVSRLTSDTDTSLVRTVTECTLDEYAGNAAMRMVRADRSLTQALLEYHLAECYSLESRLADLGRRLAEERIARLVLELHSRLQARGLASESEFYFPLTQEHIADALGMTAVHVGRTIRTLRDKGILKIERSQLHMVDRARLAATAGI